MMSGPDSIKVMIVDDHDMVRTGLRTYLMLEPKFQVIAEAGNGQAALDFLDASSSEKRPDIILMDLMMPGMNGIEATKAIMEKYPDMKIVMLTSFLEDDKVYGAIEAGAVSYVLKTVSAEELIYAISGAFKGMPVMTADVSQALTRGLRQRTAQAGDEGLTEREKEVLFLIADGQSNKEIAEELHISVKTVKTHVSNLLMKCELEDRTQLAVLAHRKGWANRT
ncbi:LuxR family two component transcriptional regulator [Paenibacillus prosopidis]|uniref:LuxR family two component transcriptional regulator n=2 Tax=Paenibacillus prosopidis TaxID=630520 RepID=A0A368VJV2_9BACL|nr:LuxR family two component transcriptional regulator [Paenibacillus prosopidis]